MQVDSNPLKEGNTSCNVLFSLQQMHQHQGFRATCVVMHQPGLWVVKAVTSLSKRVSTSHIQNRMHANCLVLRYARTYTHTQTEIPGFASS